MTQMERTWEDLNKPNRKRAIPTIITFILSVAMLFVMALDIFGLADFMADQSISAEQIKLYGGILFGIVAAVSLLGWRLAFTKSPMQRIEKYAKKTNDPQVTLAQLQDTWENGQRIGPCYLGEHYIIEGYKNGIVGKIISLDDVVWAYKTITKMNGMKMDTSLFVHYSNAKGDFIILADTYVESFLQYFYEKRRDVVVGNDKQVEKMYQDRDYAGVREFALQQRTTAAG